MAATMFARTLAGNAPEYLNMAGYAGYGMAAVVISCLAYAFPGLYLIWQFGAQGATYALFISNCLLFGLCLCFIYYKDDVRLLGIYSLFFLLSVCLIIGLITFGFLSPLLGSVLLLALLVLFIVQKGAFRNLVAILKIR